MAKEQEMKKDLITCKHERLYTSNGLISCLDCSFMVQGELVDSQPKEELSYIDKPRCEVHDLNYLRNCAWCSYLVEGPKNSCSICGGFHTERHCMQRHTQQETEGCKCDRCREGFGCVPDCLRCNPSWAEPKKPKLEDLIREHEEKYHSEDN